MAKGFEESIKELEIISKLYLNEKLEKEYKLEDLFNAQEEIVKQIIKESIINNTPSYTEEIFEKNLKNISNAFVDWRYFYETDKSGNSINIEYLKQFANALKSLIVLYK